MLLWNVVLNDVKEVWTIFSYFLYGEALEGVRIHKPGICLVQIIIRHKVDLAPSWLEVRHSHPHILGSIKTSFFSQVRDYSIYGIPSIKDVINDQ